MSETILTLKRIGIVDFSGGNQFQAWRLAFDKGLVWHGEDPIGAYATSLTLFVAPPLESMQSRLTLLLDLDADPGVVPEHLTLHGVYLASGRGSGCVAAATTKYTSALGAAYTIQAIDEPTRILTIAADLFARAPHRPARHLAEAAARYFGPPGR